MKLAMNKFIIGKNEFKNLKFKKNLYFCPLGVKSQTTKIKTKYKTHGKEFSYR